MSIGLQIVIGFVLLVNAISFGFLCYTVTKDLYNKRAYDRLYSRVRGFRQALNFKHNKGLDSINPIAVSLIISKILNGTTSYQIHEDIDDAIDICKYSAGKVVGDCDITTNELK